MPNPAFPRRFAVILVAALLLAVPATSGVDSAEARPARASKASKSGKAGKAKRHKKARRAKKRRRGNGRSVPQEKLRTEPLPKPSGDIWVWSPNLREEVKVNIYNADGSFNQESLAALDHKFRCKRTGEERAVDPKLYEILSIISDHFGGKRIELTSGFRFQKNEGSRHFHASAMDIRVPGVSMRELYQFAETLDGGNMGIGKYPRSGFVHIDFRAPGEPSYRWVDFSGPGRGSSGRRPSSAWRKPKS
jgi:uncharacterized protein YcbK (DUF882 family)